MSQLAPLHNPPNLAGIRACMRLMPGIPQVAVFDTAFHATIPDRAYIYALPYDYYTAFGVRRYGFHGTSHQLRAGIALEMLGDGHRAGGVADRHVPPRQRLQHDRHPGRPVVDTSMGLTPTEGLVMGTRSGDLDPAILVYLARRLDAPASDIDRIINKESGLLGVSGLSSDMRDIEDAASKGHARAALALEVFCYRIRKYVGAYAAAMGGLDAIVFTAGIGENSPVVRERACRDLGFLGVELDEAKNASERGRAVDIATAVQSRAGAAHPDERGADDRARDDARHRRVGSAVASSHGTLTIGRPGHDVAGASEVRPAAVCRSTM